MPSHQWPLPAELGLDTNDPFYSLYTVLYQSHQASLTTNPELENALHLLRRTHSELLSKFETKESQIQLLENFSRTQRFAEQQREETLEELRKTNLEKKEIQEQLVNFAKRNVILANEITQKDRENRRLILKVENGDYVREEAEELRREVEEARNLAMVKQDELENLRRTLSTALFTRNQMPTNSSDAGSILSSSTVGRASSYSVEDHTENDFDNRTLVASTLRSGRSGHYDSRQTSATPSSNTSQNTIKTPTVSVYSPPTSPFNDAQSSVPKDLHPLRGWASRSVFSLSLSRNNSSTLTVNTLDNNDSSTGDNSAVACHRLKKKPSSLRFWRRDKD